MGGYNERLGIFRVFIALHEIVVCRKEFLFYLFLF